MKDSDLIISLRERLVPQGTRPVVRLHTSSFYNHEFITDCINEVERMWTRKILGEEITTLEKLALTVLCESAGISNLSDPE